MPSSVRRLAAFAPLAVTTLAGLSACGRIRSPIPLAGDYPRVESSVGEPVVARGDTLWVDAVGPVALVTRDRAMLGRAWPELSGGARAHQRMFGRDPVPVTVLLVPLAPRPREHAPHAPGAADSTALIPDAVALTALLPDSLARRPRVWYAVPTDRTRRGDLAPGATPDAGDDRDRPVLRWAPLGRQVAQQWILARTAGPTDALAPWLHAALVSVLGGGGQLRPPRGLLERRGDGEMLPLDSLFARRCESEWRPVRALDPAAPPRPRRASADAREDREERDARCGARFQAQSHSVLAFMLERAGDGFADDLVRTALRGEPVERALVTAGRPASRAGLPPTVRELEVAWRAWLRDPQGR